MLEFKVNRLQDKISTLLKFWHFQNLLVVKNDSQLCTRHVPDAIKIEKVKSFVIEPSVNINNLDQISHLRPK